MRKNLCAIALLSIFMCASGLAAYAQDKTSPAPAPDKDEFFPDLYADVDMRPLPVTRRPFTISYGGWITPTIIDERSGSADLMTSVTTARLWLQSTLWKNSLLYVRGRDVYLAAINEEGGSNIKNTDNLIDLDVAYLQMASDSGNMKLCLGRKFYILGTGLAFNGRGDGGEFDIYSRIVDIKVFGAYTGLMQKDANPYGLSSKDISDGAKRIFAGGAIERGFGNQTVYLLALAQMDRQEKTAGADLSYDSQYYGAGLKGLLADGLNYYGEFIYERGTNKLSGASQDISAYAGMAGIDYYPALAYNPAILLQYAYGSGDGNPTDDSDTTFTYFGTFVGGYALRPQLRNIHIFRIGCSVAPFYKSGRIWLTRMNLLARYSYYMKDNSKDATSDPFAAKDSRDIGHGVDLSLRWSVFYDLGLFVNYGLFMPGGAYPSSADNRNFLMAGANLTF